MPDLTPLLDALSLSVEAGYLGTSAPDAVAHAQRFVALVDDARHVLDLGSGGGVPGLPVAVLCPLVSMVLLDNRRQRTDLLTRIVLRLRIADRVAVRCEDAQSLGHDPLFRGAFDLVTVRSFGPPAFVAECAAPFLGVGGRILVSEPPGEVMRWPDEDLSTVGLRVGVVTNGVRTLHCVAPCPDRYARAGRPRPLF